MELFQSATLGVVQGITEFLPISSSAHLILFPWFLGWKEHSITFDVALHIGTLLAILIYFAPDFVKLIQGALRGVRDDLLFLGYLIIGTIPAAVLGLLAGKIIEESLRGVPLIAINLIWVGVLLWWLDEKGRKNREVSSIRWQDALLIGSAQALSLMPGVSRSGITMTMALFLGLTRHSSARFSFLLSAPIMLAAGAYEGRKLFGGLPLGETWLGWGIGVAASAVTGLIVIRFLLQHLERYTFRPFVIYRILLGLGIAVTLIGR